MTYPAVKMEPNISRYVPTELQGYVSGGTVAIADIAITFPINKTMFRQIANNISATNAVKQLYREGAVKIYRGVLPVLGRQIVSKSLMFGNYEICRQKISNLYPQLNTTTVLFCAATFSGCSSDAMLTPFERIQILLQDSKQHTNYKNTWDAVIKLSKEHGVTELFRGGAAIACRGGMGTVLYFYFIENTKQLTASLIEDGKNTTSRKVELLSIAAGGAFRGAVIGCAVSTILFPFKTTITHMQLKIGGSFQSFRLVFLRIVKKRGFRNLYRGVRINSLRSAISWGVMTATYEIMAKLFH